ncbi:MAG: AraC family transcriptional regulator [Akkermansiaceae bacterium]|nr:AraC family transcriptional regulator [Armatimonadota bacterium]
MAEFPPHHRDAHLPDTGSVAAFSFQGKCRIAGDRSAPQAAFTGLHESLRAHEHYDDHSVLLAIFTPVGASAFLGPSLEEFAGTTTDLAAILDSPGDLDRLHIQLIESPNNEERIKSVEEFMMARMRLSLPDPLVSAAVAWLEQGTRPKRIEDLTRYIGLSQSALERRFRRIVGVAPKKFASLVRLQEVVRSQSTGADLTAVARSAGYFDQSHFIKDFRRMVGIAPDRFFRHNSPARDAEFLQFGAS